MKIRALNARAASLCEYLCSRNNDIAGYWGIGVLCATAAGRKDMRFNFTIFPGKPIYIDGHEIIDSTRVTNKLLELQLDSIEGRLSFSLDGRFPSGVDKYACEVFITIARKDRIGMGTHRVSCWTHDASQELRRAQPKAPRPTLFDRLRNFLRN